MHQTETSSLLPTGKHLPLEKLFPKSATATHFCHVCRGKIETNSWRSVAFGGEHICQNCYYMLRPIFKPVEHFGVPGTVMYAKTEKLDGLLQGFLLGENDEVGKSLFVYAGRFFWARYHGYAVISVPEFELDPAINPAEKILLPFGFSLSHLVKERIVNAGDCIKTDYVINRGEPILKRVILFSCRPNPKVLKAYSSLLKKAGVISIKGLFLSD